MPGTLICRRADSSPLRKHAFRHNCIRANVGVVAHSNISQDFCASTDIHVASDDRQFRPLAGSDRNLLKNETINSNDGVGMYHDAVRVWNKQPAPYPTIKRNICARAAVASTGSAGSSVTASGLDPRIGWVPLVSNPEFPG